MANQPIQTLRDGALKASIWKNEGSNGPFYSVTFGRTYTDEADKPQTADSFSGSDLLKLSVLAVDVYRRLKELRAIDKQQAA